MKLFGVDVAALVKQNIAPGLPSATLVKVSHGGYDANNPSSGASKTTTSYPCRAIAGKTILDHDKDDLTRTLSGKITVVLGTLPAGVLPAVGDQVVMTPPGFTSARTFAVTAKVDVDPAGATATFDVLSVP